MVSYLTVYHILIQIIGGSFCCGVYKVWKRFRIFFSFYLLSRFMVLIFSSLNYLLALVSRQFVVISRLRVEVLKWLRMLRNSVLSQISWFHFFSILRVFCLHFQNYLELIQNNILLLRLKVWGMSTNQLKISICSWLPIVQAILLKTWILFDCSPKFLANLYEILRSNWHEIIIIGCTRHMWRC